jgi:hypothetical protein
MKKLLLLLLLSTTFAALGQDPIIKFSSDSAKVNLQNKNIQPGDEFIVNVKANGNGDTDTRSLYFDFEYNNQAFDLISIDHTGTNGNGGIMPSGSQITSTMYSHPGYSYIGSTAGNGNVRYENSNYSYTAGGPKTIVRYYLSWAVANGGLGNDVLLKMKFRLKSTVQGSTWDPIKLNFAAAFNQNGSTGATVMENPLAISAYINADSYVDVKIRTNGAIFALSNLKVSFQNPATNTGVLFDVTSDGKVNVVQSQLQPNTTYRVTAMVEIDKLAALLGGSVTVSDYTAAQAEFTTQNLDGTFKNQSISKGAGYIAADINKNRQLDGGDLNRLFSQSVGVDPLVVVQGYTQGSNGWISAITMKQSELDSYTTSSWKDLTQGYITFATTTVGTNLPLNIAYILPGDVNGSHSSLVAGSQSNNSTIRKMNRTVADGAIDVNIKNVTVTSNTIEIPVDIKTNGNNLCGLQFEFKYDPNKIKFEELKNEMPNTWYVFANKQTGVIKFGALDKELKTPVTGDFAPFKLKFSTLQSGLDINSYITISPVMDAANSKGRQLNINLSTDTIKLTGYNNF